MKTFSEWKLLREERDIAQSAYNAMSYFDNQDMYEKVLDGCIQDAQQQGNQQVVALLKNMRQLANYYHNVAPYTGQMNGQDPQQFKNQLLSQASGICAQIRRLTQ